MLDMFGLEYHENKGEPKSKYLKWKRDNNYRQAHEAAISCRTCIHKMKKTYHDKNYYKCEFMGNSNCGATDIRLSSICNLWERDN